MNLAEALRSDEVRAFLRGEVDRGVTEAMAARDAVAEAAAAEASPGREPPVFGQVRPGVYRRNGGGVAGGAPSMAVVESAGGAVAESPLAVLEARAEEDQLLAARAAREARARLDARMQQVRIAQGGAPRLRMSSTSRACLEALQAPVKTVLARDGVCGGCGAQVTAFTASCRSCGAELEHGHTPRMMGILETVRGRADETEAPERIDDGTGRVLEAEFRAEPDGSGAWRQRARLRGLSPETIRAMGAPGAWRGAA